MGDAIAVDRLFSNHRGVVSSGVCALRRTVPQSAPHARTDCLRSVSGSSFGQLTYRESLRDIVACLQAKQAWLYHLGFRGHLSRTNLAYANGHRDWRLFQALAQILMRRAARLYQDDRFDPDLPKVAFALDSSIISLSLNLFPWGYYARSKQAALKLHLMLSLQGNLPAWAAITEANFPDMKMLDDLPSPAGPIT